MQLLAWAPLAVHFLSLIARLGRTCASCMVVTQTLGQLGGVYVIRRTSFYRQADRQFRHLLRRSFVTIASRAIHVASYHLHTALSNLPHTSSFPSYTVNKPPSMSAPPPNARDTALGRGWTPTTWLAAGHSIDPYIDSSAGGHWTANPYVSAQPPATIVAASGPRPPPLRESSHILPTGLFNRSPTESGRKM